MRALVTGASEGIGRSFAIQLAQQGYAITAVARNEIRLRDLLNKLDGKSHEYIRADLTRKEDVEKIANLLRTQKFDLLVNNAGFAIFKNFEEASLQDLHAMMALNCDCLVDLSHAFLQTAKSGDALINVSSSGSYLPVTNSSIYTATKHFVTGFSESLWYEQRKRNIYVMALCPGVTKSNFLTRAGGRNEDVPNWFTQTPDQLVKRALKKLSSRRSPIVLSGPQRPLIFLTHFIPRKWTIWLSGKAIDWGQKKNQN